MPNVSLGPHLEDVIESQVKNGRFQNANEVVRAALRLLEDRELERAERAERLARCVNEVFRRWVKKIFLQKRFSLGSKIDMRKI